MEQYSQEDFFNIIKTYNSIDRQIIKKNLKIAKIKYNFKNVNITADLKYNYEKVRGWFNMTNSTIPKFEDALQLAVHYNFDIKELVQEI